MNPGLLPLNVSTSPRCFIREQTYSIFWRYVVEKVDYLHALDNSGRLRTDIYAC